jgi:putative transposase
MKKSRFSEEQIIGIFEAGRGWCEDGGSAEHVISAATFYQWKQKFGGMTWPRLNG